MSKKLFTKTIKEHSNQQHCPTCNTYVTRSERYPNYVCSRCIRQAVDKEGQPIQFFNITTSGHGVQGKYVNVDKLYRSQFCFIKTIKCRCEEAYLGGTVIMPVKPRTRSARK